MSDTPTAVTPLLEVRPRASLVDAPVSIRLTGLLPGQTVTVRTQMRDDAGENWSSSAVFRADAQGQVDVATQKPLAGSYAEADGMGLFWSLLPERDIDPFIVQGLEPLQITFLAEVEGEIIAQETVERRMVAPEVTRTEVREDGLVATLFEPPGGPHAGLIVCGGSDGGLRENYAALLASHGYCTLALAYFGVESLPRALVNIPLEYFETAIQWLQARPGVRGDSLGVVGASRGGELALLLGSMFPALKAVVAQVPSGFVWCGFDAEAPDMGANVPAWTYRGHPLPFLGNSVNDPPLPSIEDNLTPIAITPYFLASMQKKVADLESASIPVERTEGAILLISGADDQMWPSALFSDRVLQRLRQHDFGHPCEHLRYEEAGHTFRIPYRPPLISGRHPLDGRLYAFGGTVAGNVSASVDAWTQMLHFLQRHLSVQPQTESS
jgi:dienelactone hydrolase